MFCNGCGAQNPDGARFCAGCGTALPMLQNPASQIPPAGPSYQPATGEYLERARTIPPKRSISKPFWIVLTVLLLICAGAGYFAYKGLMAARDVKVEAPPIGKTADANIPSGNVLKTGKGPDPGNLLANRDLNLMPAPGDVCAYLKWVRDVVEPRKLQLASRDVLRDLAQSLDSFLRPMAEDPVSGIDKGEEAVRKQSEGVRQAAQGLGELSREFQARPAPTSCEEFKRAYWRQLTILHTHFEWLAGMFSGERGFTGAVDFQRENSDREKTVTDGIRQADEALQRVFNAHKFTDPTRFHIQDPAPGGKGIPIQLPAGNGLTPPGAGH